MSRLTTVFLTTQLYRLWSGIGIRLETDNYFHGYFPLDESLDVAQETAFIDADQ